MTKGNQRKNNNTKIITITIIAVALTLNLTIGNVYGTNTIQYELLIVGPQSYEGSTQKFIGFKLAQQVSSRYVSTETIGLLQSDEPAKLLHDFVANQIIQSSIKYLLLVGNYEKVPTRYVYSPSDEDGLADFNYKPTDWYYSVPNWDDSKIGLLGANIPQITVGRLPVNNNQELERTLSKIVSAENSSRSNSLVTLQEPSLNLDPSLNVPHTSYTLNLNLTITQLDQTLSQNAYAASYTHGTPSALWTKTETGEWKPLITYKNATDLISNFNIFYIVACFSGAIDLEERGLAQTLITSSNGPALVIASSRTEGSDNTIASTFWEKFFATGKVGDSLTQALRGYVTDPAVFSPDKQAFQRYNFYLDKVIYGDPSWLIEGTQTDQVANNVAPQQIEDAVLLSRNQGPKSNQASVGGFFGGLVSPLILWGLFVLALIVRMVGFREKKPLRSRI